MFFKRKRKPPKYLRNQLEKKEEKPIVQFDDADACPYKIEPRVQSFEKEIDEFLESLREQRGIPIPYYVIRAFEEN